MDVLPDELYKKYILKRSEAVRRPGREIGWFELVAWCYLRQVDVHVLMGEGVHSMREWFGGSVVAAPPRACHRLAMVRCTKAGWKTVGDKNVFAFEGNHYVIGVPAPGGPMEPESSWPMDSAFREAARQGWRLMATAAQGDCGIDALCHHDGQKRTEKILAASSRPDCGFHDFCVRD